MFAFEAIYKEIPTSFALPMFCFASLLLGTTVSEVEELNGKVQFSSKVHFFGELELNLVHFLAN